MVSNSRKKRLDSSYITWAFSKAKSMALFQALATIFFFLNETYQAHLNNYNDLLQSWVCLTRSQFRFIFITERNNSRHTVGAGSHEDRQGRERRSDHQHIVCSRYNVRRSDFSRIILSQSIYHILRNILLTSLKSLLFFYPVYLFFWHNTRHDWGL